MSETNETQLKEVEDERKFWRDPRTSNIFNLFVQGKDIPFIAETLSIKPVTAEGLITNRFFIKRLEEHIRGVLFTNQVAKVIAASDVFSKLWDRVTNNIEDIPPEICLKELTKMFPQKKEGMIINPKNMNVFMKVMQGQTAPEATDLSDRLKNIDDPLHYEGLEEDDDAIYPELGEGQEEDGEQRGDPGLDPSKQSQDQ